MGRPEFIEELKAYVNDFKDHGDGKVSFSFIPVIGRCAGQQFRVGYEIPGDFPVSSPSGVHVTPRIFPNRGGTQHPTDGINDSPAFGPEWHYWSRPMHHWKETKRSVKDILDHLQRLYDTL